MLIYIVGIANFARDEFDLQNDENNILILLTIKLVVSMKVEKEMKYEAPEVEVLEVEVEAGFGPSGDVPGGGEDPFQVILLQ